MDLQLSDRTAVVTGASKGLGLAIVRTLTAEGMRVVAAARTITPQLKETGAVTVPADLATPEGPGELIAQALAELGEIDLLVNNVGGGDATPEVAGPFADMSDDLWQRTYELNLFSAIRATRAALPSLLRRRGGVVNISSISARMPSGGPMPYATAKAALTVFGKALSEEVGPQGVRVNTISPGAVRTAMWEESGGYGALLAGMHGVELEQFLAGLPAATGVTTGRLIEPEEVASLVAWLASPHAASVTGADHIIDGGVIKTA
ncbi:oxidoreductase [Nonomuraea sp. NPDC049419]|uniref:oxidoreductase n=1 Tax=Nonomuraea sp. NPDC049419 TaxID=3155772 RepID=UPI00343023FF